MTMGQGGYLAGYDASFLAKLDPHSRVGPGGTAPTVVYPAAHDSTLQGNSVAAAVPQGSDETGVGGSGQARTSAVGRTASRLSPMSLCSLCMQNPATVCGKCGDAMPKQGHSRQGGKAQRTQEKLDSKPQEAPKPVNSKSQETPKRVRVPSLFIPFHPFSSLISFSCSF